jgi:hypothetical protein
LLSTDQRGQSSGLRNIKTTDGTTLTEHVVDVHGLSDATQNLCSQILALKIPLHQTIGRFTDGNGIGLRKSLDSGGDVWCFSKC